MRLILYVLLCLLTAISCSSKKSAVGSIEQGGGFYISFIDSSIIRENNIAHLGNSLTAVGFSAKFAKKHFRNASWVKDSMYFTPDTGLMKRISHEIDTQYCSALATRYKIKGINSFADLYCKLWKKNRFCYDQQYIGYISTEGDSSLYIKLIDFREDPHNLKPYFTTSWIDGWHGWFSSNVITLTFNLDKNLLY